MEVGGGAGGSGLAAMCESVPVVGTQLIVGFVRPEYKSSFLPRGKTSTNKPYELNLGRRGLIVRRPRRVG